MMESRQIEQWSSASLLPAEPLHSDLHPFPTDVTERGKHSHPIRTSKAPLHHAPTEIFPQ